MTSEERSEAARKLFNSYPLHKQTRLRNRIDQAKREAKVLLADPEWVKKQHNRYSKIKRG